MLDYQGIAALAAVVETQSFQSAANKLFITQSAVTQRIKTLEHYYGEPLLIRTQPYRPTQLGLSLLGHFKRVQLLESALQTTLKDKTTFPHISISISRDSLETWFPRVLDHLKKIMPMTLEIIADDQELTLQYLQKGLVSACASTSKKSLTGCKAEFIGYFDYVLVATPTFIKKYFRNHHISKKDLLSAPTLLFDQNDKLFHDYLRNYFHIENVNLENFHVIPSVAGFKKFAVEGYAYGLIPYIDIAEELKQKRLINLFPDKIWHMPVYWHSFEVETAAYRLFNDLVLKIGQKILSQT